MVQYIDLYWFAIPFHERILQTQTVDLLIVGIFIEDIEKDVLIAVHADLVGYLIMELGV